MSVRVIREVFDRYPAKGGPFTLALALADHAHDDGTSIFPGVDHMARKSRQTRKSVITHLKSMVSSGWLQPVRSGGGRGNRSEYRINPEWLAGAEITPNTKGEKQVRETVKKPTENGEKREAPNRRQLTTNVEPSGRPANHIKVARPEDVCSRTWSDWLHLRASKRAPVTNTVLQAAREEADKAGVSLEYFLRQWCLRGSQGLKAEWMRNPVVAGPSRFEANSNYLQALAGHQEGSGHAADRGRDSIDVHAVIIGN